MNLKSERKLWNVLGTLGLLLGMAIMIGAVVMLLNGDDIFDKTPSRIQAIGAGVGLCGVAALVLARLLGLVLDREEQPNVVWTVITYGTEVAGVLGGMVLAVLWRNSVQAGLQEGGLTPWQKSGAVAVGFLLMTGVISLIGERTARLYIKQKQKSAARSAGR